jgi:hypothetical protein
VAGRLGALTGVGRAESDLEAARKALELEREQLGQEEASLEQASGSRHEFAEDAESFGRNEAKVRALRAEVQRRRLLIGRRETAVAEAEQRLAGARYDAARAEAEKRCASARKASIVGVDAFRVAATAAAELTKRRAEREETLARARELLPPGVEFALPKSADEADWPPDLEQLVAVIQGGPHQPHVEAQAASERTAEQTRRNREALIEEAVRREFQTPSWYLQRHEMVGPIERLPAELRAEARKRYVKRHGELKARAEEAAEVWS